jgi:hypothetical protein
MTKYNHIAVCIRGQKRVWDSCKLNQFHYFNQIAHKIDYYFTTWEDSNIDSAKIKQDFDGKTLVEYIEVPLHSHYSSPWSAPAWLTYNTVPFKKVRERQVKYDAVFDQRTDCIIWQMWEPFELDAMTMYTPEPPFNNNADRIALGFGIRGITDYGCMSDSNTYDLLAYRFINPDDFTHSPEEQLQNYCTDNNIDMPGLCVINHLPARPDICRDFKNPIIEINTDIINRLNLSHTIWKNIPLEEKLQILQDHNLNVDDFLHSKFELGCK